MSPWPPEGEPSGKGTKPVTLPRPGHADLAGSLKYGHEDVRNALGARERAAHGGARCGRCRREGAAPRARDRGGRYGARSRWRERRSRRSARRPTRRRGIATRSVASSRCGRPACAPGLGSYAVARGSARRAAGRRADVDPGGQGRRGRRRVRARAAPRLRGARRDRAGSPPPLESGRRDRGRGLERRGRRGARRDEAAAHADEAARLGRPRHRRARPGARRAERRARGRGARGRGGGSRRLGARAGGEGEVRRRRDRRPRRGSRGLSRAHRAP